MKLELLFALTAFAGGCVADDTTDSPTTVDSNEPPMLGAHSREVLGQFGCEADQIEGLLSSGTVIQS